MLNKRYQLRFTLFMVGISTVLMLGLGIWVMRVANETTKVSKTSERGRRCPAIPTIEEPEPEVAPAPVPMKLPDAPPDPSAPSSGRKIQVTLDEMEVPKPPPPKIPELPKDFGKTVVDHWTCELEIAGNIEALEAGRLRILFVMIATGLLLVLGLAVYGIKTTHRVAGPLFKVSLYLAKMRDGRFDKVYNLRKGDQLVQFYDHFKQAHAGIVRIEREDIERMKAVIAAAEAAGAGEHAAIVQLRDVVERKEKALE
ncbi:MAG TPA: hypothetical protein VFQ53_17945 [Kofleriaceae bacterium]|nr:hypothetical protein [Kofleriaceae bacterium]